jgi:hypothetical protein
MDGSIRSGQDVLKAVALGASTTIGRSTINAYGREGVTKALQIIHRAGPDNGFADAPISGGGQRHPLARHHPV